MAADPPGLQGLPAILRTKFGVLLAGQKDVAVAVSGGPDSMALCHLLSRWAADHNGPRIHALTVDHGLRPESASEAARVAGWLQGWPNVTHTVLMWENEKPRSRVQEAARAARYELMAGYCAAHGINRMFIAHHRDDQAETLLFRLAKGTGLDGLAGMREVQPLNESLTLLRPCLDLGKEELIQYCKDYALSCIEDPSNRAPHFARTRLRHSRAVLEAEGLSAKRLAVTAARLSRARKSLEQITEKIWRNSIIKSDTKQIVFNFEILCDWPDEIILRVLERALRQTGAAQQPYGPRLEKLETLLAALLAPGPFRKRTLGGATVERDDLKGLLTVCAEHTEKRS